MKTKAEPIGRTIRRERRLREWSQEQLGRRVGVSRQTIIRIEDGSVGTRWETVERIKRELGIGSQPPAAQRSAA